MDTLKDQYDLARNYGFDITMPDGNIGIPGAAHRDYLEKCQVLYKQFLTTMNCHLKKEMEIKKTLVGLRREKMNNFKFSLYRSAETNGPTHDPFMKKESQTVPPVGCESRATTPWGLDPIVDEDENPIARPHTAPAPSQKCMGSFSNKNVRPQTAGFAATSIYDAISESGNTVSDTSTHSTVVGWMDSKTEGTSARKIIVTSDGFAKLSLGEMRARLKNRSGRFIIKPTKRHSDNHKRNELAVCTAGELMTANDAVSERRAMVRRLTNYRSPTLSSDMKINNRIPIQKSLQGKEAKRTTVTQICEDARDRKTRHFRVVTNTRKARSSPDVVVSNDADSVKQPNNNRLSAEVRPYSRVNSRAGMHSDANHENVPLTDQIYNTYNYLSAVDGVDYSHVPHTFLLKSANTGGGVRNNSIGEPCKTEAQSSSRPCSRITISRPDSRMSQDGTLPRLSVKWERKEHSSDIKITELGCDKGDKAISLGGLTKAAQFITRVRRPTNGNISPDRPTSRMSFESPPKVGVRQTSQIINALKEKDAELGENMAKWRRRMFSGGSGRKSSVAGVNRVFGARMKRH